MVTAALILQREHKDWAVMLIVFATVLFFSYSLVRLEVVVGFLKDIWGDIPVDRKLMLPLLKMLGISYAAELASSICADAGHPSIGNQVELFAKLSIVVLSLPGLSYLLQMLEGIF